MMSLWCHNRYFPRPSNFAIFEGRSSEFGKLGYFDVLSWKLAIGQHFISIISFSDTL